MNKKCFRSNKKGEFFLQVIITLILSFLLLAIPIMCASKFFRLSEQAKNNFYDFTKEIKDFAASEDSSKKNFDHVLILDDKSAIVTFTEEGKAAFFEDESAVPEQREKFEVAFPGACGSVPCMCLCRKFEEQDQGYGVVCRSLECTTFPGVQLVMDPPLSIYRGEYDQRRVLLHVYKFDDGAIRIEKG